MYMANPDDPFQGRGAVKVVAICDVVSSKRFSSFIPQLCLNSTMRLFCFHFCTLLCGQIKELHVSSRLDVISSFHPYDTLQIHHIL